MLDSWIHFPADTDAPARMRRRLVFAGLSVLAVVLVGVTGYWFMGGGQWSWSDCAYMVLITITTVGFSEVLPINEVPGGRLFTAGVVVSGLGLSLYFMSSLTAFIIEGDLQQALWRRRMRKKLDALRDHVIVCGAGETGRNVINELLGAGLTVVVIEREAERLDALHTQLKGKFIGITADATEDETLLNAGLRHAQGVITALHSDRDNLFVTVTARQINPNVRIVSRAVQERSGNKLLRAGADAIVSPNLIGGHRMAHELMHPKVVGFMDLLIRDNEGAALSVSECRLRSGSRLHGVQLMQSGVRGCGVLILSVLAPDGETHTFNPPPEFELREGMTLIAMGSSEAASALEAHVNG